MQKDPMTEFDLTVDPVTGLPSPAANPEVRQHVPEHSTFRVELDIWKGRIRCLYSVHGPLSWAPLYCAMVLLLAVGAAVVVPSQLLGQNTSVTAAVLVALASAAIVLAAGGAAAALLFTSFHKKS